MGRDTIKVFLRMRPEGREAAPVTYDVQHTFDDSTIRFHLDRRLDSDVVNHTTEDYGFRFDRVFEGKTTQEDVFNSVAKECVASAIDGYNSTIFAYGQTGSGKTFSITGGTTSYDERGVIPRSLSMIFAEAAKRTDYAWTITLSYLQIYNEKGQDLLNRGNDAKTLEDLPVVTIAETEDEIVLKGLEAHPCSSVHDALNLLFLGDTNRLYCETPMNKTSSRSHCVLIIGIEARQHGGAMVRRSKLNIVDLAGSERVAKTGVSGTLLTEAKYINLSLHHLEHVILALSEHRGHIPYRNTMMTMVLRDSLGSNCRTVMLATCHPGLPYAMETISTCRFAQRVSSIKQNAHVNEEQDPVILVRQLKREISQLKDQIAFLSKGADCDPNRAVQGDELERCKEAVQRFLKDPDPAATVLGLGGDWARVSAVFRLLKSFVGGSGGGGAPRTPLTPPLPSTPITMVQNAASLSEVAALKEEIRRLNTSMQQRENELSLLFQIVQKHGGPRSTTATQTGDDARYPSVLAAAPLAALAGGPRDVPLQHPGSLPPVNNRQGASPAWAPPVNRPDANAVALAVAEDQLSTDYNLAALSDADLLKDRAAAFETFRRSYRKHEQIAQTKEELQTRFGTAKSLAASVNRLVDGIKGLKHKIQQLRAEKALLQSGTDTSSEDAEEAQLTSQLDASKAEYHRSVGALAKEKERIEHMQLMVQRTQDQLLKDFESWFSLRQQQVQAALQPAPGNSSSSHGWSSRRAAATGGGSLVVEATGTAAVPTPGEPSWPAGMVDNAKGAAMQPRPPLAAQAPLPQAAGSVFASPSSSASQFQQMQVQERSQATSNFRDQLYQLSAVGPAREQPQRSAAPPNFSATSADGGASYPPGFRPSGIPAVDAELLRVWRAKEERDIKRQTASA